MNLSTPGARFRSALAQEQPLQIMGTINAYCALMAAKVGYRAIYLSGAGVANAAHGLPDLGMTSLDNVLEEASRITSICDVPLLVDIDTGWGNVLTIDRTIRQMVKAGVAAVHLEDQVAEKRCGHLSGKRLVSIETMQARIRAAASAKAGSDIFIIARTDAVSVEGLDAAIHRAKHYIDAGADGIFAEAVTELPHYREFVSRVSAPVLADMTEFGQTPLFTTSELAAVGVSMVLYPLTAWRAMNAAALEVYQTVRAEGTQQNLVDKLQDRKSLYEFLNYFAYEKRL